LDFSPNNEKARELAESVQKRISTAATSLKEVEAEIFRGDFKHADQSLRSLNAFRQKFPSWFDDVGREWQAAQFAEELRQLWADGKIEAASQLLTGVLGTNPRNELGLRLERIIFSADPSTSRLPTSSSGRELLLQKNRSP